MALARGQTSSAMRGDPGLRERRQHAVVEPGIVRPGKHHKRRGAQVAQAEFPRLGERVAGRQQDTVLFLQQQLGRQPRHRSSLRVEKPAGDLAGLE